MATPITVQPELLSKASSKISADAADYKKLYDQLFQEVEKMGGAWKGTDNTAYSTQIAGFKADFKAMYDLMIKFSQYLQSTANIYAKTQSDIAENAKRLTN